MTRIKVFWARRAAIVPVIAVLLFAGLGPGRAAGLDPVKMTTDEIKALEQRLTDAGCYKGAIDGAAATRSTMRSRPAPTSGRFCASRPACIRGQSTA
jgi:hypothetical protein